MRSPPSISTENTTTEPIAAKAPIRWRNSSQSYRLTAGQSTRWGGGSSFGVLAELVAHDAANLAQAGALLERRAHRHEQVLAAAAGGAQLLEAGVHRLVVAVFLEGLEALDLLALGLRVHPQDLDLVDRVGHVLVHPDDDVLLLLVALLVAPGRLLDLGADERNALHRAAQLVDLVDQRLRRLLDLVGEGLDDVRAGEGVGGVGRAGLVGQDLLGAQGDARGALARQRQRFVE